MYNPYCVHLNIPFPILAEGIEKPSANEFTHFHLDANNSIDPHLRQFVESKGFNIFLLELFYYPPGYFGPTPIHIDGSPGDRGKINWVYGGKNSLMNWYKSKKEKQPDLSNIGTYHVSYTSSEVELIYSCPVKSPSIIQAGIPHNIINTGAERWCFSLVLVDSQTEEQSTFSKLVKEFAS